MEYLSNPVSQNIEINWIGRNMVHKNGIPLKQNIWTEARDTDIFIQPLTNIRYILHNKLKTI